MRTRAEAIYLLSLLLAACASSGPLADDACKVEVVGLESWVVHERGADAAFQVRGVAGSPARVSLVAVNPSGSMVSGYGVEVGPGHFAEVVEQKLTGVPERFIVLLEVGNFKRCKADLPRPA